MNYSNKRDIIEEQRYLIGIEPVVDMKNFVLLLLADLARKTKIHDFQNPNLKVALLPLEYRDIIEKLCMKKMAGVLNLHLLFLFITTMKIKESGSVN